MRLDRDLGVAFFRAWTRLHGPVGRGWEMHAATGVRGLRVLHETDALTGLLLTELSVRAEPLLHENARRYGAEGASARRHDARNVPPDAPFDLVDVDPYGSPLPFLDSAIASLRAGGLLAVTATDLLVLAGVQSAACERLYSATPVRGRLGPEGGLRILLAEIDRRALARGLEIRPLLAYVGSHHLRAYVRLEAPKAGEVRRSPVGRIDAATFPGPRLPAGGLYGPMWIGPLFDPETVESLSVSGEMSEPERLARFVASLRSELAADRPFYFEPNELARSLSLPAPPPVDALLEALRAAGAPSGRAHERPGAFKSAAPREQVEALAREVSGRLAHSQKARVRA